MLFSFNLGPKGLIDCEINPILTWSAGSGISSATGETKFAITDTKLYAPVVILSTQDNAKLLEQFKSYFKRIINWNKYQLKNSIEIQNQHLDYIVDPSFQGANRPFVLSFEDNVVRAGHIRYFLTTVEIKDCNVLINGRNFSDQPVKNDRKTYDNIRKIATGQGGDLFTRPSPFQKISENDSDRFQ